MNPIKELLYRLRCKVTNEKLVSMDMTVSKNFRAENTVKTMERIQSGY